MIEQLIHGDLAVGPKAGQVYLCVYGHFYQPPREDPFSGIISPEVGATPYANFNEKITAECYQPNAEQGNFAAISYDFGPTLAAWMERAHPDVYQQIIESDHLHMRRYGVGNALAAVYNHTILPLASTRDKRTQIVWGLEDFRRRYGHDAHGMWLAETAVDLESLDLMAQYGVTYAVLAPWQAATAIDPNEPYRIALKDGRSITAFFYNGPLSGGISFDPSVTNDANVFITQYLSNHIEQHKRDAGEAQIVVLATDGELYGHHKQFRDKFLSYLVQYGAPEHGLEICTLERYMQMYTATKEVKLHEPSSWSCMHGVARWSTGCVCTEGDSSWKNPLRQALNSLNDRASALFEEAAAPLLRDPWAARDDYITLHNGWESLESFWDRHGKRSFKEESIENVQRVKLLLESQYYLQYSFTSCGFFFEDLDRIEPRNDIAFARRAISLIWQALHVDLQPDFVNELAASRSWRTQKTGADLYLSLPILPAGTLPETS